MAKRVAVMQPYFFPYAGYFRLFAQADEFIIFDCVQFPRRGRVHRTDYATANGPAWLTLPLAHQPRDTLIKDLAFAADASAVFAARLARQTWYTPGATNLHAHLARLEGRVIDHLHAGLELATQMLAIPTRIRRSSEFELDPELRGQARVIAVAQAAGATHYLNAPGGRALYDDAVFQQAGLKLEFLLPYTGQFMHLLPALLAGQAASITAELTALVDVQP